MTLSPVRHDIDLYFRLLDPNENVRAADIVDFLKDLRRHLPRMLVIWDGASIHDRSRLVKSYWQGQKGIETETLPAYAPELNPDECVWSYLKHAKMHHYAPTNVIDLYDRLQYELEDLARRPHILRSFVNQSKIELRI